MSQFANVNPSLVSSLTLSTVHDIVLVIYINLLNGGELPMEVGYIKLKVAIITHY